MKMTVGQLIETLEGFDPDAVVRLAVQPSWPFEHSIGRIEEVEYERKDELGVDDPVSVVYIAEDSQLDYLPGIARDALGW